jgi:pyruvyl transferase EpsO
VPARLSRLGERALASVARLRNQRARLGLYDAVARQRLRHGTGVLARADVVITDRLHGHILSVLMGKPHVVLDNSYGKVRTFFETWTGPAGAGQWAESSDEAMAKARQLRAELR